MIKFIIRCIKQSLFTRYTIEPSLVKSGSYALFEGTECLAISDNKTYLESYLKTYINNKRDNKNFKTLYFDRNGNEL